jgi:hypothetical protein
MREQAEWYWNGTQAGPRRRDVIVWRHDSGWSVEQRTGDGASTVVAACNGDEARKIRRRFTGVDTSWFDMSERSQLV